MGRFVDLSRPITEDERAYLLSRSREGEVMVNDRQFGNLDESEKLNRQAQAVADHEEEEADRKAFQAAVDQADAESFPAHIVDKVEPLTLAQLRTALEKRKQSTEGERPELQVRLAEFLEAAEARKNTEDVNG